MKKAIFLDRDGVINETVIRKGLPSSPFSLDELKILPKVKESILTLKKLNFICVVVTNQPDVSTTKPQTRYYPMNVFWTNGLDFKTTEGSLPLVF